MRVQGPFLILASGARERGLGFELWIDFEEPLAKSKGRKVTSVGNDAVALRSGPCRLITATSSYVLKARAAVIHAPRAGHKAQELPKSWSSTSVLFDKWK
eukprot:6443781-Pyramimonas_sp.AAC.1